MTEASSHRQILRSSTIIGGASAINIVIGLLRMKVVALLLGPGGVGLIGLLQNLMTTAGSIASLGFGMAGTRQIAEAHDDATAAHAARRALVLGTAALAVLGAAGFWVLRSVWARRVFDGGIPASDLGWLAVGVALTVVAGAQGAVLNGKRRIGDIARVNVFSALVATILGISAITWLGHGGLIAFVVATPVAASGLGWWYVSRLPPETAPTPGFAALVPQLRTLARLGVAFMVSGVAMLLGQLLVRTLVQRTLGAEALGQFQAAWLLSMTYIGFVLGAMATDYYPRLTEAIHDPVATNRMVNEQAEVALLLAAPVFLGMLACAPWLLRVLYSAEFVPAASILRWQILGDVLKLVSWPLSFVMLAAGAGRLYVVAELLAVAVFVGVTWLALPRIGLEATGVAFLCMYAAYLPVVYAMARRRTGFRWTRDVARLAVATLAASAVVALVGGRSALPGAALGLAVALAFAAHGYRRLALHVADGSPMGALARLFAGRRR